MKMNMAELINKTKDKKRLKKLNIAILSITNVVLVVSAIFFAAAYSGDIRLQQEKTAVESFCNTVESMKRVASNYMQAEGNYVRNWISYIESQNMTEDEALEYIRQENCQSDRYAHIVDMDTYEARSTYVKNGDDSVSCYQYFCKEKTESNNIFLNNMENMFNSEEDDNKSVLGKYRIAETQITAVSVGSKVKLNTGDGQSKYYLLLRVIPLESMKNIWVFPIDYSSAEVGLITCNGDYIVQSNSMKSENFIEFIRSYNYKDNYNGVDELCENLNENDRGVLDYKNSKGEECYWYFSKFADENDVCILGYINKDKLLVSTDDRGVLVIACTVFILLFLIDGAYILHMNKKLSKTAYLAKQASIAKTNFLSSVSHDIRTPMNAIIGMTNIARKNVDNPEYVTECLDKVLSAGNHLLTLINDILDISKVESGKMVLNTSVFSVENSIKNIVNMLNERIEEKGVNFTLNIDALRCRYVIGDELRINQICINIITNAIKYTNAGGSVEVCVSEEEIPDVSNRIKVVYVVSDSGIGMSEEYQKVMYDSFSRAKDSRIDKIQGSGLGLAIAKQMIEMMNGTITCESRLGEGTKFTVSVELEVPDESQVTAMSGAESEDSVQDNSTVETASVEFEDMKVLVAEDNDINWEIIAELLKDYGITAKRAENGEICVDMAANYGDKPYDIIFMDIQMPVMNGIYATQLIRKNKQADVKNVVIYAMSADAFAEDINTCMEAGMNGHIPKPIDMKNVLNALRYAKNIHREEN